MSRQLEQFVPLYGSYLTGYDKAKETESQLSKQKAIANLLVKLRLETTNSGIGNVGLRELIMEPVQRIPRYNMILEGTIGISQSHKTAFQFRKKAF